MSEPKKKKELTNRQFSKQDKAFQDACKAAGIEPTHRQASKFRRGIGAAYAAKGGK